MQSKNPVFPKSLWKTPNLYMTIPGIYFLLVAAIGLWSFYWSISYVFDLWSFSWRPPIVADLVFLPIPLSYIVSSILGSRLLLSIKKKGLYFSLILLSFWQIISLIYFYVESPNISIELPYIFLTGGATLFPLEWLSYVLIFTLVNSIMFIFLIKARKLFLAKEIPR